MKRITGLMMYYFHVCKRKLWYFAHDLSMEHNSDMVSMGKFIDENAYSDKNRKHILIDDSINIDFIQGWSIIHEIKKSPKIEEASIWQVKFYMKSLKEHGLQIEKGIIDYPVIKRRKIVELTDEDLKYIQQVEDEIVNIICKNNPPELEKNKYVKSVLITSIVLYEVCNMKRNYYLFRNGTIKRNDNTIKIITENDECKDIPIENVSDLYLLGEHTINSKFINHISTYGIPLHFYNYYGFYSGSYIPRNKNLSGYMLIKQAEHYSNENLRLILAKEFIEAGSYNLYRNVRYYNERGTDLSEIIYDIQSLRRKIPESQSVEALMGVEGNIRKLYYSSWNKIVNQEINFDKRVKRPPDNKVNSLISFCNSLVYTAVLSEIYKTQLNPTISYLHVPGEKRYSLSLDIAEIFKPLIADRMIFSLLNKNIITDKDFDSGSNFLYLKENSRKKIIMEFDERIKKTIKHKDLGKSVSYRYLIRLECYKLIKHLTSEKQYKGFKIWW